VICLIRLLHLAAALLVASSILNAQSAPAPTILCAETKNNTSASDSFQGMPNGVPAPGNVSRVQVATLLSKGHAVPVYAHWMGWFGAHDHADVGYRSDDREQIRRQVEDMVARGFAGVIASWDDHPTVMKSVPMLLRETEQHPGFAFAFELENQFLKHYQRAHGNDVTQGVLDALAYGAKNFERSPAYMVANGRPVVFFFGGGDYSIDWNRVKQQAAGDPLIIFRNATSFEKPYADGAFAWTAQRDPNDEMVSYLNDFYGKAAHSNMIVFGSAWAGFDDRAAGWGKNRVTPRNCGRTWLDTFAAANRFNRRLDGLRAVTWNDYEEGTAIEPGIDNCLNVTATLDGSNLRWSAHGGSEDTLSFYKIFISPDGSSLTELASVPAKTHSIELKKIALPPGNYTLFVKAIGKPSILNHMSNGVAYSVAAR
jgi:Glycosyl hydrolase family 71